MAFNTTNLIPHLINIDFKESNFISIPVEQYDKDSAYIEATLYDGGSPYIIPAGSTASFGGTKPSSHIILETAIIENNKVYYKISEQCTVKEGDYPVKFTLYLPNNAVKYTQEFKIKVRKAVMSSDAIADVDEVNVLNELIVDASESISNANESTINANEATNNANNAANNANTKATLADEKATLANSAATLANEKAGLANTATTNANTATNNANTATSNANIATTNANNAANLANEKAGLANTAATNANDVATQLSNETLKIYKGVVVSYSDLATTYPNPENGWTVTVSSESASYRYNGTEWINLGVISSVGTATNTTLGVVKGGGNINVAIDGTINVDELGDLSTLDTVNKSTLVEAINEVNAKPSVSSASDVTYDNTESGLESVNVQGAVDELNSQLAEIAINVEYPPAPLVRAIGDGITDDTVALQACYDLALATGRPLYLPRLYRITADVGYKGTLTENIAFPTIYGNKASSVPRQMEESVVDGSAIIVDGVGIDGLKIVNNSKTNKFFGGVIKDLAIIKGNTMKPTDGSIGLHLKGCVNYRFYNVSVMGFDVGFKNDYGWSWDIFGITTIHNNIGIILEDNSNACGLFGVQAHQNNIGLKIVSGSNISIDRITVEGQNHGIVITSGEAALVPNRISIKNIYSEVHPISLITIGKDENGVTAKAPIVGVNINGISVNGISVTPIQLDNVNGVVVENILYQNSLPFVSHTANSKNVIVKPLLNYESIIGGRYAVENRIGVKNNYNLIANGLFQFPNIRFLNANTGWVTAVDTATFTGEKVIRIEVPTGVTSNNSTRLNIKINKALVGKRLLFTSTAQADVELDAKWLAYGSSGNYLNKGTNIPSSLGECRFDLICPDDTSINITLSVKNTSGTTKYIYIKYIVMVESGVDYISTSPLDILVGMSGRVSATTTGTTVEIPNYNNEQYNVIVMPRGNYTAYVTKGTGSFTITSSADGLVDYMIIPTTGMFI